MEELSQQAYFLFLVHLAVDANACGLFRRCSIQLSRFAFGTATYQSEIRLGLT